MAGKKSLDAGMDADEADGLKNSDYWEEFQREMPKRLSGTRLAVMARSVLMAVGDRSEASRVRTCTACPTSGI